MEQSGSDANRLASLLASVAEEVAKGGPSKDEENDESSKMTSDTKASRRERRESDTETLTHSELLELTSSTLDSLLKGDTVLSDLPTDVTVDEVAAQIALVQGQSMTVTVAREDGQLLNVVVAQSGTVTDLKRAIQRHVTLRLGREGRSRVKVNWRYVWRSNGLALADGTKLALDDARLRDAGIRNKTTVRFVKRFHEKHRL